MTPLEPSKFESDLSSAKLLRKAGQALVIDDDRLASSLLRILLEKEGHEVFEAADGELGLSVAATILPDIILLDAVMPGISGFECCQALHRLYGKNCPPILMITSLDDPASIDQAFTSGATEYINKPINWSVLRQRVRRLLQTHWAMQELRTQAERKMLQRLVVFLDALPIATIVLDQDGKLFYSNQQAQHLFGQSLPRLVKHKPQWLVTVEEHCHQRSVIGQTVLYEPTNELTNESINASVSVPTSAPTSAPPTSALSDKTIPKPSNQLNNQPNNQSSEKPSNKLSNESLTPLDPGQTKTTSQDRQDPSEVSQPQADYENYNVRTAINQAAMNASIDDIAQDRPRNLSRETISLDPLAQLTQIASQLSELSHQSQKPKRHGSDRNGSDRTDTQAQVFSQTNQTSQTNPVNSTNPANRLHPQNIAGSPPTVVSDGRSLLSGSIHLEAVHDFSVYPADVSRVDAEQRSLTDSLISSDATQSVTQIASQVTGQGSGQAIHQKQASAAGTEGTGQGLTQTASVAKLASLEVWGSPIIDEQGNCSYTIIALQDITQRKAIEAERQHLTQQLSEKNSALLEMNQLKDEFLKNMSHELRTPINGIMGYTQILLEELTSEQWDLNEAQAMLQDMDQASRRLLRLIENLLDFSALKASTLKINLQPTRLHACLQKVLEQKQAELTEKSLHLDLGLDLPDREVWADPDRLIQVLWHLLDNAIKFTPQGQICIYTEVINLSAQEVNTPVSLITEGQRRSPQNPQNFQILPDGDDSMQRSLWVRLTLCDTGIGFDPQQVHKLFQSFFMADGSMTRKNGGTGIGLALCQTLMYRMGGRICLSSPGKNQGCTAFIELPLVFPNVYPSI